MTQPTETSQAVPDSQNRWRCGGCGNLTRFDVTLARRATQYWHFDLAGEHAVEEETVHAQTVEQVTCRWCGRSDAIELVDRNDVEAGTDPGAE